MFPYDFQAILPSQDEAFDFFTRQFEPEDEDDTKDTKSDAGAANSARGSESGANGAEPKPEGEPGAASAEVGTGTKIYTVFQSMEDYI